MFKGNWYHLFVLLFTTTIFALTVWFSRTTFPTKSPKNGSNSPIATWLGFSSGVAILNTLQKVTSTCTTFAIAETFEILEWTLVGVASEDVFLSTFLSLSPTTALSGLLNLAISYKSRMVDRFWALARVLFLLVIWLSGIALFINTTFGEVYESSLVFNVTAGVGTFNGSFVSSILRSVNNSISYWTLTTASTFLLNPQFSTRVSPVVCDANNSSCESYLLPGGLQSINPIPPDLNLDPVVVIHSSLSSQVEFNEGLDVGDSFGSGDCVAYGDDQFVVGLQLCVARSSVSNGSIIAGIFVCSNGVSNGQCRDSGPYLNVSTTMTIFSREAIVTGARSNNSILSVSSLTKPTLSPITEVQDFEMALGWLLNYTAARLPPVSSITFLFWNRNAGLSEHDWDVEAYVTLKSILGFTSWFFTANNYGNPEFSTTDTFSLLPTEFHTSASTVKPSTRFIIDRQMFALYSVLQAIPLGFCWAVLLWRMGARLPQVEISSFPVLDFIFKAEWHGTPNLDEVHMEEAGDKEFRSQLKNVRVAAHVPEYN